MYSISHLVRTSRQFLTPPPPLAAAPPPVTQPHGWKN